MGHEQLLEERLHKLVDRFLHRSLRVREFRAPEPKHLVAAEAKVSISGNHFGVQTGIGTLTFRIVVLAVNLEDDPLSARQEHQKVHALPEQNAFVRETPGDLRIVVQVDLRDERRQLVSKSLSEIAKVRLEEFLLRTVVKRGK
ncbi:hypothetical protein ACEYYB_14805 [Paracoccus sp. p4-l81]|uniref:hypothetical protein n=1 Tax=Paracoccus sp. p4-l81 TaxID=3342806 RepID=UPI0035BA7227